MNSGITDRKNIYLVFKKKSGSNSTYLLNINEFKFTYGNPVIPIGLPVALKSKNNESISNNEFLVNENFNKGSEGQKYLCADRYQGYDLCANREDIGKENKFTILTTAGFVNPFTGGYPSSVVVLNSSSNGKNIKLINSSTPINASGGDFKNVIQEDFFSWVMKDDNTVLLSNLIS